MSKINKWIDIRKEHPEVNINYSVLTKEWEETTAYFFIDWPWIKSKRTDNNKNCNVVKWKKLT